MEQNENHTHDRPIETFTVTIDPNHGTLEYQVENLDYPTLISRIGTLLTCVVDDMHKASHQTESGDSVGS